MKTSASISIQVYVDCPHCDNFFDLLDDSQDIYVEKSDIMVAAFQDEWGCDNAEIDVKCPECEKMFIVESIFW